jgi:hypothetical protein
LIFSSIATGDWECQDCANEYFGEFRVGLRGHEFQLEGVRGRSHLLGRVYTREATGSNGGWDVDDKYFPKARQATDEVRMKLGDEIVESLFEMIYGHSWPLFAVILPVELHQMSPYEFDLPDMRTYVVMFLKTYNIIPSPFIHEPTYARGDALSIRGATEDAIEQVKLLLSRHLLDNKDEFEKMINVYQGFVSEVTESNSVLLLILSHYNVPTLLG